jgi:Nucleoside 2-deoxyribosyltransferase like
MFYVQSPSGIDVASPAMRLFLAGSIDSGMAEDWQSLIADRLRDLDAVVFNPRRATWTPGTALEAEPEERDRSPILITQASGVSSADSDQPFAAVHPSFLQTARDRIFCRSGAVRGE